MFEAIGEPYGVGLCLLYLGTTRLYRGEYEEARSLLKESASVFKEVGAHHAEPFLLDRLGEVYCATGHLSRARQLYEACLTACRQIGNQGGIAQALSNLGNIAFLQEDYERARRLLNRSLEETPNRPDDRCGRALTLHRLGLVSMALGDHDASRDYFSKALAIVREVQATPLILEVLTGVAEHLAGTNRCAQAIELLTLVLHHPASWQTTKNRADHLLSPLRAELPPDIFEGARERSEAIEPHQAVEALLKG
jgi:tetratricopeptide (TPR) repeat protein